MASSFPSSCTSSSPTRSTAHSSRRAGSALGLLATAPSLDRELAAELLGTRTSGASLRRGTDPWRPRGTRREARVPPAGRRVPARNKREGRQRAISRAIVARCLAVVSSAVWSGTPLLISLTDTGPRVTLEAFFADALDELLNAARLATVETWIGRCEEAALVSDRWRSRRPSSRFARGST